MHSLGMVAFIRIRINAELGTSVNMDAKRLSEVWEINDGQAWLLWALRSFICTL